MRNVSNENKQSNSRSYIVVGGDSRSETFHGQSSCQRCIELQLKTDGSCCAAASANPTLFSSPMFVFPLRATWSVCRRTQNIITLTIHPSLHPSFVNCPSGSLKVLESGTGQRYNRTPAQPSFTMASGTLSSLHSTLKPPAMRHSCLPILPQLPH